MKRILIIRSSAIGDVVFATPIVSALRTTYPDAFIAWLVEPGIDQLLQPDPGINECILWPKQEWIALFKKGKLFNLLREVWSFRSALRNKKFEVVLDLQGILKSGVLGWLSGAPRRIGLGSREGSQWLMTEVVERGGKKARISSEYLHLSQRLRLDGGQFLPHLYLDQAAEASALLKLKDKKLVPGQYAVFAVFTTRPQKHWVNSGWKQLGQLTQQQISLTPLILGGAGERQEALELAAAIPGAVSLAGDTSLAEAVALIRHAGAVIGVDTGLTHMGIALSVPTVAIFGSTCPYTLTCRENAQVIWLGLSCSPCKRNPTCAGAWTCLKDISAERVFLELERVYRQEESYVMHQSNKFMQP